MYLILLPGCDAAKHHFMPLLYFLQPLARQSCHSARASALRPTTAFSLLHSGHDPTHGDRLKNTVDGYLAHELSISLRPQPAEMGVRRLGLRQLKDLSAELLASKARADNRSDHLWISRYQ